MSQQEWARKEIEIAMKNENPNYKPFTGFNKKVSDFLDKLHITNDIRPKRFRNPFDYGCGCYESAFKAFSSLCDDGHSGLSFSFTKQILERLMDGRPLTPIENVPEVWSDQITQRDGYVTMQCLRMSSLFKDVHKDGTVTYSDVDRVIGIGSSGGFYGAGYLRTFIDELYPITMPYCGVLKPYCIYTEDYLSNPKNGDFDTVALIQMTTPDGEKIEINKYFGESKDGFIEISFEDYLQRKEAHVKRGEKPI